MKFNIAVALTLAVSPALAIPPADFGFPDAPNNTELSLAFRQDLTPGVTREWVVVSPGELFGIEIPQHRPIIGVNTSAYSSLQSFAGEYTVMMVDPDASSPDNPNNRFILHWLLVNVTQSQNVTINRNLTFSGRQLVNRTEAVVPYLRPRPPTTSSAHRYILYAFQQPANFAIPAQWSGLGDNNRTRFNLTNFIRDTNLGTPAAANYFYCSNQTGIPANFTGAPGSNYPIGNGLAITSGTAAPSVSASATGTAAPSASASASGSGSAAASSTSKAGAPMVTAISGLVGAGLIGLAALM